MENEDLMVQLAKTQNLSCVMYVEEKTYPVRDVSIAKSTIPVRKPTTRGGVYFTDVMAYKIKVITQDLSITREIPKLMLGPSTDFKPILIKTKLTTNGKEHPVTLTTHLTNTVNTKGQIELNLIVDQADLK
jgi:hypothetical protein